MKLWHGIALALAAAASTLASIACQSVHVKKDLLGFEITIVGDDGQLVNAKGLEEALAQAQQNLQNAQNKVPPNPNHVKDWKDIVHELIEKKNTQYSASAEGEWDWHAGDPIPAGF